MVFPALPVFNAALAAARALLGEIETAATQVAEARARDFDTAYVDVNMSTTLHFWAEAAVRVGDRDAVIRLDELLAQITDRTIYNGVLCFESIDVYRALLAWELGRDEEADALWRAGCSLNEQTGLALADLQPLVFRGHRLARHGRSAESAEDYHRARALAQSRNLEGMVELADAALAAVSLART